MKKIIILTMVVMLLFLTGCGKKGKDDVIKDLSKKINNASSYKVEGTLQITNNDDTYNYDISVAYEKSNMYRVSLVNKSNDHEQIILKNKEGVYVITPSLNKSFKFQSDWPHNNSQIYLLDSLLNDIKEDKELVFEETKNGYTITTKVNYPNNARLVNQKITLDKDLNFDTVEVLDAGGIPQMVMKFNSIDMKANFDDNYFKLDSIIKEIEPQEKPTKDNDDDEIQGPDKEPDDNTEESGVIDDIIYPLYIPTGTSLTDKEKVEKTNGERVILTFDGEKPFLLVEETASIESEFSIIPTYGEPYLLADTVGALSSNSITWVSNGIEYYIVSDAMSQSELIQIASSISAIPTMK